MSYVAEWARAFAITTTVELCVATPLLARAGGKKRPALWRCLGAVIVAQVASHPAVWFVFPTLGWRYALSLAVSELWAVASEIFIYKLVFHEAPWSRAVAASALANAASYAVGLAIRYV
jgi:hypothetical protein